MRPAAWLAAALAAVLLAACGSAPQPPTPYQRYLAAIGKAGMHPKQGRSEEIGEAKHICHALAAAAESDGSQTNLVFPEAVSEIEGAGYSERQGAVLVTAVIDVYCPQWKVLLKQ